MTAPIHWDLDDFDDGPKPAGPPIPHRYLSTGCFHGHHDYCKGDVVAVPSGPRFKTPAKCKFCPAPCICPCHQQEEQP